MHSHAERSARGITPSCRTALLDRQLQRCAMTWMLVADRRESMRQPIPARCARAISSISVSMTNAVWVDPTLRHHSTSVHLRVMHGQAHRNRWGSRMPSAAVASMPFLTIIAANGEPLVIDWPTIT